MRFSNILETIGNTPVVRINRLFDAVAPAGAEVWMKLERANPGGSIKDRIGVAMIEDAERRGRGCSRRRDGATGNLSSRSCGQRCRSRSQARA